MAQIISKTSINARLSYAGRVSRLRPSPIEKRIGGFGGVKTKEKLHNIVDVILEKKNCESIQIQSKTSFWIQKSIHLVEKHRARPS